MKIRDKYQIEIQFSKKEKLALKRNAHGGTKSNAKNARPFVPKKWMQLCNRSSKATGKFSMLTHKNKIYVEKFIRETAKRYWIEIGDYVNMGNHYHLKIKARRKVDLQNFLRVIHTHLARFITGAKRGKPFGKFWDGLTFSEVLTSAMRELRLKAYFEANRIEAREGRQKREEYWVKFNKWVSNLKLRSKFNSKLSSEFRSEFSSEFNSKSQNRFHKFEVQRLMNVQPTIQPFLSPTPSFSPTSSFSLAQKNPKLRHGFTWTKST